MRGRGRDRDRAVRVLTPCSPPRCARRGHDGSPESEHALAKARSLATRTNATVKALSVVSLQSVPYGEDIAMNWPHAAKRPMDDRLRRASGLDGVEGHVTHGRADEELATFGEHLDLLIVGSRGCGPIGRLLYGSTSNRLAHRARGPLLVLPRVPRRLRRRIRHARPKRSRDLRPGASRAAGHITASDVGPGPATSASARGAPGVP
jgi:nucleotide-binding universal stress UspA family protein